MAVLNPSARRRLGGALGGLLLLALGAAPGAAQPSLEYAVKANFLYKFAPFVGWPPGAFAGPASPFYVCVVGDDPFGGTLEQATRGQFVGSHPVVVRRLTALGGRAECHVAYVGAGAQAARTLRLLDGAPVLTVTDERQGVNGGVVHFVLQGGRVRFTIDLGAARAGGLAISSKLLALALPARVGR